MKTYNLNKQESFFAAIIFICLQLGGCAPSFSIKHKKNNFRNTEICGMTNNLVNNLIGFDLKKNTEYKLPYSLTVSITTNDVAPIFRKDSIAHLNITRGDKKEVLSLTANWANYSRDKSVLSSGGYYSGNYYVPHLIETVTTHFSTVIFKLSNEQLQKIIHADGIRFEIETLDKPLTGVLKDKNIKNIKEFSQQCLSGYFEFEK